MHHPDAFLGFPLSAWCSVSPLPDSSPQPNVLILLASDDSIAVTGQFVPHLQDLDHPVDLDWSIGWDKR